MNQAYGLYQGHVQEKAQPLQRKSLQLPKKIRGKDGKIQYNITMTRGEQGVEEGEFCS